jgi:hypothetical protein
MGSKPQENKEFAKWLKQWRIEIENRVPVEQLRPEKRDAVSKVVASKRSLVRARS